MKIMTGEVKQYILFAHLISEVVVGTTTVTSSKIN